MEENEIEVEDVEIEYPREDQFLDSYWESLTDLDHLGGGEY